jgi:hypothetical protein
LRHATTSIGWTSYCRIFGGGCRGVSPMEGGYVLI